MSCAILQIVKESEELMVEKSLYGFLDVNASEKPRKRLILVEQASSALSELLGTAATI